MAAPHPDDGVTMSICSRSRLLALLACLLVPAAAFAQAAVGRPAAPQDLGQRLKDIERDPKLLDQYYRNGRKVAAFCANCHGEGGNSLKPDIPNLAGQNTVYLLEQVRQFGDGRRRNEFMEGLIKAMSSDEKLAVAVYYASQEVDHKPAANLKLAMQGKTYYDKICFRCHGEQGRGGERYARVAGQQADYLSRTLKRYRDGTGGRIDPLMAANTRTMKDEDIAAVVAYIASMK